MGDIEILKGYEFICSLNEEEQQLLAANLTKVSYLKGERIVKNGEFVSYAVFVLKGLLKIHSAYKNKAVIFEISGPGSFSALSFMIGSEKHVFDISSIDDSVVLLINIDVLRKLIEQNGQFAQKMVKFMNDRILHYFEHNFVMLTQSNIHGRLANTIIHLSQNVFLSHNFDILLSRKELSQLSNISRENVIKVLYEFDAEGLIKLNGQQIHILNMEQLKHLAKTC